LVLIIFCNCSITPGNSAWIADRAGVRRYDFVDNAQHFQVIPTKVGIQMFFFSVRLPSVIEQLPSFSVLPTVTACVSENRLFATTSRWQRDVLAGQGNN
jgi:hypothetical protein